MTGELHFNGRYWRQKLGDEQAVRFLELLYNRAGGAQAPDITLVEASDLITNINEEMNSIKSLNDRVRHRLQEIESADNGHALDAWHRGGYL